MKKKILVLALATLLMTACGTDGSDKSSKADSSQTSSETSSQQSSQSSGQSSSQSSSHSSSQSSSQSSSVITKYQITFKDESGNLLETKKVIENTIPSYNYSKSNTKEWIYTFLGWATSFGGTPLASLPKATADATYFACVQQTKQRYTVTFNSNGGSTVNSVTEDYGTSISKPTDPTYASHAFVCWCSDPGTTTKVDFPYTVQGNVTLYAKWNEVVNIKQFLSDMMKATKQDPYSYIPEAMRPDYSSNLVTEDSVNYNFENKTTLSTVNYGGYGEQWNMVISNIKESENFYKVLTLGDTLLSGSVSIFNSFFDNNPGETSTSTDQTNYKAYIKYESGVLKYTLLFKTGISIPLFGTITPQIDMTYNITTLEKSVRIQLSENNAMKYIVTPNKYIFAIEYGITQVSRKAFCQLNKLEDDKIEGHIYEFVQFKDKDLVPACADFYIDDKYVSAVGNKASGIIGFTGYINELYNVNEGKLLGYEIRETRTVSSIEVTFNTLWFNLSNVTGLNNIKAEPNGSTGLSDNKHDMYVKDSASKLVTKNVGGISKKTLSRRYDIELRKRYYYTYDSTNKKYVELEKEIPMLFVQEEVLDDYSTDINSKNSYITSSITLSSTYLNKIKDDYATLIDIFIQHKDDVTSNTIQTWIGSAAII